MGTRVDQAYAAPNTPVEGDRDAIAIRRGKLIGLLRTGVLPAICTKCGATKGIAKHRKWMPAPRVWPIIPLVLAAVWILPKPRPGYFPSRTEFLEASCVGLAAAELCLIRWARVSIPLCAACVDRYRRASLAGVLVGMLEVLSMVTWILVLPDPHTPSRYADLEMMVGSVLVLTIVFGSLAALIQFSRPRTLRAWSIDSRRIWVTRVHPAAEAAFARKIQDRPPFP